MLYIALVASHGLGVLDQVLNLKFGSYPTYPSLALPSLASQSMRIVRIGSNVFLHREQLTLEFIIRDSVFSSNPKQSKRCLGKQWPVRYHWWR